MRKGKHLPYGIKNRLFIIPSFLGVLFFSIIPFINVLKTSLFNIFSGEYVGLDNYILLFKNCAFQLAASNMVKFMIISIPVLCVFSLIIACWLEGITWMKNWLKTSFLIPMILPISAVVLLCQVVFGINGFINRVFEIQGIDWINSTKAMIALIALYVWKNMGYTILLWCAALEQIPSELYEAASLDGANKFQRFKYITMPSIKTAGFIISVISIINAFKVFRESYLLSGNYPHESVYMIQNVFNNWFREMAIDKISAGAVIVAIIIGCLVYILERYWGKEEDELRSV